MDPIAHTLFGAALAESGLKRRSRYATATLMVGANLPDIDVVASFWGPDMALLMRRGHTHGVVALVLLPLLLAAAVGAWHRWRGGRRPHDGPAFDLRATVLLAYLSVWSHPFLDWLNTYGVRVLMPFDDRWFYGDTLFIVDPWLWLLMAAGVVLARSSSWAARFGWLLLAGAPSLVLLSMGEVPVGVKVAWFVGVAAIVALRWRRPAWAAPAPVARLGLATLALYVGGMYGLGRLAEATVLARHPDATVAQSNPGLGDPLTKRLVVASPDRYRIVAADGTVHELRRVPPDDVVAAALADPSVRGFVRWMRFPHWTVEEQPDHWVVTLRDLRYVGPDIPAPRGIGEARVVVAKHRH